MTSPGAQLSVDAQPLIDAIAAALAAAGVPYGDGERPAGVGNRPYVVGWTSARYSAHTLAAPAGAWTLVLTAHCVGLSAQAARLAADRLAQALHGLYRARVGGRAVGFPEQLAALPLTRDDDAKPDVVFTQTVEWRLRTTPARDR